MRLSTFALLATAMATAGCDARVAAFFPLQTPDATWSVEAARLDDEVVELLSVGTHLGLTAPANNNDAVVTQRLGELGVRHALDLTARPDLDRIKTVGAMRVHFQIGIRDVDDYLTGVLGAGSVIEALQLDAGLRPDEVTVAAWQDRRALCDRLRAAVQAWPGIHPLIVGPDLALPPTLPVVDFGPCLDLGTVHRGHSTAPPTAENASGLNLDQAIDDQHQRATARPLMLGLEGYAGDVSETVQARYLARLIFETFNRGLARVYLGGVTDRGDETSDPAVGGAVYAGFAAGAGLARADGSAKPSFTAVRNLVALLADAGTPTFAPGMLRYRLEGAPADLHHTLLQRRDGTFWLALWLERPSAEAPMSAPVTVRFPFAARHVAAFAPQAAATPVNEWQGTDTVPLGVTDDVTLLQIAPVDPCDRASWTATASFRGDNKGPPGAIDGNLTTRWNTGRLQDGTDWFQVDFGAPIKLGNITLNNNQIYPGDFPGAYEVRGSQDGVTFDEAPFAAGIGTYGSTVIDFPQRTVRAVKVSQVGVANNTKWWGIGEFQIDCAL